MAEIKSLFLLETIHILSTPINQDLSLEDLLILYIVYLPSSCHVEQGTPQYIYPAEETSCSEPVRGMASCMCPSRVWAERGPTDLDCTLTEAPLFSDAPQQAQHQQKLSRQGKEQVQS